MTSKIIVSRIEINELPVNWHWIAQLLSPAVAYDKNRTMEQVRTGLFSGALGLASLHGDNGAGLVVVEPCEIEGVKTLWLPYMVGKLNQPPKRWLSMIRQIMAHFETLAKEAGCSEVRIGGRNYRGVFPGFETFDALAPNRMRKAI